MNSAIKTNSAITAEIARLLLEQLRKNWNESGNYPCNANILKKFS